MSTESNDRLKKVCIIGAGAAGLCAVRNLLANEDKFVFVVYEQADQIGGTWVYSDEVGLDKDGRKVHSSMYKNLQTNIPLNVMSFPDFPCKAQYTSFEHHETVRAYLEDYADHYGVKDYIKFRHEVNKVKKVDDDKWEVTVTDLVGGTAETSVFDAIFVCNGRFTVPNMPDDGVIKNLSQFKGEVLHTHDYRKPEPYTGKRVIVLGVGPSGMDIGAEVSTVAQHVYMCQRALRGPGGTRGNVTQVGSTIVECDGNRAILENGDVLEDIDCIIFATGYLYDYAFLDDSCGIKVSNGRVVGVYQHLINISAPTMALFALPLVVVPFPLYHQQVLFFIKSLTGEMTLPTKEAMLKHAEADLKRRADMGLPERHAHRMTPASLLWDYDDELAELAKIEPTRPLIRAMFTALFTYIRSNPRYKELKFEIISEKAFEVVSPDGLRTIVEV
ncbi:Flavin-containing monooxygenase FMO GS-OX3 [Halotydeus destructor]|nr:Flavin-containing monooxygenase FMO GS-OX3 [Halotydeus destructor]